ncbi:MAG: glycosyltransferase family 2 protein [Selenomonadaceae bacterium]|nr:glycosyltransferase family 2 protein [Selenomonadaceae bacterium]
MEDTIFENEVALVLIVKNESRYIGEWLEYHYRIGVDKFYIYNNDSDDRSELLKILEPWIRAGIVDFEDAPGVFKQMPVYNDALEKHRFDCRYMGFLDADEFIYIKNGKTLPKFLKDHFAMSDWIAGLGINWRMFGTSGKQNYEPIDVIERFIQRAKDNYNANIHIKSIVNPRRVLSFMNPHSATYFPTSACYDDSGDLIPSFSRIASDKDSIQVNHYFTKSVEEYSMKNARGRSDFVGGRDANLNHDLESVEDTGLKNLWRQLKSRPINFNKDRTNSLDSVRKMLASNFTIESLMTCLNLIQHSDLLDENEKLSIEEFLLESLINLINDKEIQPWDFTLILSESPEILRVRSNLSIELLRRCTIAIPQLILICESETRRECRFFLRQIQRMLEVIF